MSKARDAFEADFIYGPRRRERFAYFVAAAGVIIGLAGFLGAVSLFPLKSVETFVVVVDKERPGLFLLFVNGAGAVGSGRIPPFVGEESAVQTRIGIGDFFREHQTVVFAT